MQLRLVRHGHIGFAGGDQFRRVVGVGRGDEFNLQPALGKFAALKGDVIVLPGGATLETVSLISNFVGNAIKIKAAGGIRDLGTLAKMYTMGVARFGINVQASMDLIAACAALPNGVLIV